MAEVKGPDDASHPHCPRPRPHHHHHEAGRLHSCRPPHLHNAYDVCVSPLSKMVQLVFLMILIHVLRAARRPVWIPASMSER